MLKVSKDISEEKIPNVMEQQKYWHEHQWYSRSPFRWSPLVDPYFRHTFNFHFHFSFLLSVKTGSSDQKPYFAKDDGSAQKPGVTSLSRPCRPFLGPLADILDFAGGAALQAVSEYHQHC